MPFSKKQHVSATPECNITPPRPRSAASTLGSTLSTTPAATTASTPSTTGSSGSKKYKSASFLSTEAVSDAADKVTLPKDGFCYVTSDVYSSPPTHFAIVASDADAAEARARDSNLLIASLEDMEVNKGLLDALEQHRRDPSAFAAHHASSLNLCFMHAYGRCRGRVPGEPATCQQLHMKPEALRSLRAVYANPCRNFFVRHFVVVLPPAAVASFQRLFPTMSLPQRVQVPAREVEPTAGSAHVDGEFRAVLFDASRTSEVLRTVPHLLCLPYASGHGCPFGPCCQMIHAKAAAFEANEATRAALHKAIEAASAPYSGVASAIAAASAANPWGALPPPYVQPSTAQANAAAPAPAGAQRKPEVIAAGPEVPCSPVRGAAAGSFNFGGSTHILSDLERYLGAPRPPTRPDASRSSGASAVALDDGESGSTIAVG